MLLKIGGLLPFSWLKNIPLCMCSKSFLFINPLMGVLGLSISLVLNNTVINTECMYLFEIKFSFSSGIYSEVELLDHMVGLFLIF